MEDESYQIIKKVIPKEWVIRDFNRPDYGIDLVIELFEKVNDQVAETLGEYLYVQVKSVTKTDIKKKKIYPVSNVAKGNWNEDKSEFIEIDVIKYVIDTDSVYTIQRVGGSVSVLIFVVDLNTENVYFTCLNDYIDKIILPKNSNYTSRESLTLTIPIANNLKNIEVSKRAMMFYGKRSKLLAALSVFAYQKNEIAHILGYKLYPVWTYRDEIEKEKMYSNNEVMTQVLFFINQIDGLDIWEYDGWGVLQEAKKDLIKIKERLDQNVELDTIKDEIVVFWHQLTNLGTMYEEICREWFLPKMIGQLTSYPTVPEIIKSKDS